METEDIGNLLIRSFREAWEKRERDRRSAGKGMGETAARELAREFAVEDRLGIMARVLTRCDWVGDCLEWKGAKCKRGYGRISIDGRLASTHRTVAYAAGLVQTIFGPEREQCALHKCDNPRCCNPKHLWPGTLSDNMQDCAAKGRLGFQK